jgi:hypothetical protein
LLETPAFIKENMIFAKKLLKVLLRNSDKLSDQSKLSIHNKIKHLLTNNIKLKLNKHNSSKVLMTYRNRLSYKNIAKIRLAVLKKIRPSKVANVETVRQKLKERQLKKLNEIKTSIELAKKALLAQRKYRGKFFIKGQKRFYANNR